jgi:transcriptional regulator with XRE-family HTH domain
MFRGIDVLALRELQGLSQHDVSKRVGILCSALSKPESGKNVATIETLLKLANSLKLPSARFLYNVGLLRK